MIKLSKLKKGQSGKIISVDADISLKRRLLELGLLKNEIVKILAISPLKNSYLLAIKNYTLALRKSILDGIWVEIVWVKLLH